MGDELSTGVKMVANNNDYFTTLETTQRLDLIRHLIENSEIVPLVRGPSGIGKSLFASRIRQLAPDNWSVCLFEADVSMSPDHMLAYIARCSGWAEMQGDQLQGLITRFETMRDEGRVPVLLIDDAQHLPPTSLMILLRLFERQREGEPLVSIVLFADDQIDILLSTPQLQIMIPQAIQVIDLPLLNREDATKYMHHLLKAEGLPADLEIDDVKLTKLYREAKGIPGLLGPAILDAISEGKEMPLVSISNRSKWIFISILGLLLFGAILFFQNQINQLFQSTQTEKADQPNEVIPEQKNLQTETELLPERHALDIDENAEQRTDDLMTTDAGLGRVSNRPVNDMESLIQPPQPTSDARKQDTVQEDLKNQENQENQEGQELLQPPDVQPALESEAVTKVLEDVSTIPGLPIEPKAESEPEPEPFPTPEVSKFIYVEGPEVEKAPVVSDAVILPQQTVDPLRKEVWILSRPAAHYTLQLLGVEHLKALKDFVEHHGLQDQAFYYKTQRKGKSWYPLLWGDFPDKKSAIKGSEQLPLEVQSRGFWARSFGALQEQLNK